MSDDDRRYRLYVVELDDAAGPRRRADRANVYVGMTSIDPAERFRLDRRPVARPKAGVRDHGLRLRPDLTPSEPPMPIEDARRAKREHVARLRHDGWGANGERRVWRVYVIELSDDVGPRANPAFPWVYVGQTSQTPEDRFRQHRDGARNEKGRLYSKWPHRHGVRLRLDLYEQEAVLYTKDDALRAEAALAERLRRKGYSVKGGH